MEQRLRALQERMQQEQLADLKIREDVVEIVENIPSTKQELLLKVVVIMVGFIDHLLLTIIFHAS